MLCFGKSLSSHLLKISKSRNLTLPPQIQLCGKVSSIEEPHLIQFRKLYKNENRTPRFLTHYKYYHAAYTIPICTVQIIQRHSSPDSSLRTQESGVIHSGSISAVQN